MTPLIGLRFHHGREPINDRPPASSVRTPPAALTWTCGLPGDISTNPVLFGVRGGDLLADPSLQPALSSVTMKVVFTNDAPLAGG